MNRTGLSKRIAAMLMAVIMIMGGIPSSVFAEEVMVNEDYFAEEDVFEEVQEEDLFSDGEFSENDLIELLPEEEFVDDPDEEIYEELSAWEDDPEDDLFEILPDEDDFTAEQDEEENPDFEVLDYEDVPEQEILDAEEENEPAGESDESDELPDEDEELELITLEEEADAPALNAPVPGTRAIPQIERVKELPVVLDAYGCEFRHYPGTPDESLLTQDIGWRGNEADGTPNLAVYAWKEGKIVYWWSPAETVYLPSNCAGLFTKPRGAAGAWWTYIDLSDFDFSEVEWMDCMFGGYAKNGAYIADNYDLQGVDFGNAYTPNLKNMWKMFALCHNLKSVDMHTFNTSNVGINNRRMDGMFEWCESLESLDISSFDTSHITSLSRMFYNCKSLTSLDVRSFDTSDVTDMQGMFFCLENLTELDVTGFDTSNVTDMFVMFAGCRSLGTLDVTGFNTSKVTNMAYMFSNLGVSKLDVSHFNTSNVTDMSYMFQGCANVKSLVFY